MTTRSLLARTSRGLPLRTSTALVGALLLFGLAPFAAAADSAPMMPSARPSTVEGTVSNVTGPILDLVEGGIQLDVTNATITGGDDRLANPLPWSGILVGARVVAQVTVPDALTPVVSPPPLAATSVVVFQARAGELSGTIQSVDVPAGKFAMLIHTIGTDASTKWSGSAPNGAVKGIGDLSAGMFAIVDVVNSGGLLATSVEAYGATPPELFAWRGPVETITPTSWTIAGRGVNVDSNTKIVGDPKVGDIVDVVALVHNPPPGSLAPSYLVAVSITKAPAITPPGPGDRATEFDGVVESIPAAPTMNDAPLGHWKISSRDVLVNRLTKLDSGIAVGSSVHVKGTFVASTNGGNLFATLFVATSITKNN
jgi:Domain of unknown function (DUF5666)